MSVKEKVILLHSKTTYFFTNIRLIFLFVFFSFAKPRFTIDVGMQIILIVGQFNVIPFRVIEGLGHCRVCKYSCCLIQGRPMTGKRNAKYSFSLRLSTEVVDVIALLSRHAFCVVCCALFALRRRRSLARCLACSE